MPDVNPLVRDTGSPPIPEAQAWLKDYHGQHGPALDLSQAVPGYPAHPEMLARLGAAAATISAASYGPIMGDAALREVYAAQVSGIYCAAISPSNVAIAAGCNQAFVSVVMALCKAGDAVILPTPWYFNHAMTLGMLGIEAQPLPCNTQPGMVPDAASAEVLITPRTRAIVLVTPNNPTGAIYPPETIAAFAALCRRRGLWLIVDETYRDFLPATTAPHGLFADPAWGEHVIQLYSFSKSYCIPGHRVGAIVAGTAFLDELAKVLDCVQICAPRSAQIALSWAIPALSDWRDANRAIIVARAQAFRDAMAHSAGWRVASVGAYFAYVAHPYPDQPASAVAAQLARERGVLTLPGPYFGPGQEQFLRFAFANADAIALAELPQRL